jgi:hypothetical protein
VFLIFSRKLPEKSSRGHTDFIFEIESPTCEKFKNIKNTLLEIMPGDA